MARVYGSGNGYIHDYITRCNKTEGKLLLETAHCLNFCTVKAEVSMHGSEKVQCKGTVWSKFLCNLSSDSPIAYVINLDFFVNLICSSSCTEDSRTEKIISIGHSIAEIFNDEVVRNQQLWQQLSFYFYCLFTKFSCQYVG